MNDCERCRDLNRKYEISRPDHLQKALRVIRANLTDGTLEEVAGDNDSAGPFTALSVDGPWEDILHYTFGCRTCGQKFDLFAETYHGQGGTWSPRTP